MGLVPIYQIDNSLLGFTYRMILTQMKKAILFQTSNLSKLRELCVDIINLTHSMLCILYLININ